MTRPTLNEQLDAIMGGKPRPTKIAFDPMKVAAGIAIVRMMRGKSPFTPRTVGTILLLMQSKLEYTWELSR